MCIDQSLEEVDSVEVKCLFQLLNQNVSMKKKSDRYKIFLPASVSFDTLQLRLENPYSISFLLKLPFLDKSFIKDLSQIEYLS